MNKKNDFMSPRDWSDPRNHMNSEEVDVAAEAEHRDAERIARDQKMMMAAASGLSSPGPSASSPLLNNGEFPDDGFPTLGFGAARIDTPIEEQLRRLLVRFFICYAPQRLAEIPAQLERLLQSGATALQVYKRLKGEYGCVPVEREVETIMRQSFITRLYCFFARHSPAQFRNVPYLARKYQYCQRELFVELETKYGSDQDPLKLFAPEEKSQKEDLHKLLLDDESSSDSDFEGNAGPSMATMPAPSYGSFGSRPQVDDEQKPKRPHDDTKASTGNSVLVPNSSITNASMLGSSFAGTFAGSFAGDPRLAKKSPTARGMKLDDEDDDDDDDDVDGKPRGKYQHDNDDHDDDDHDDDGEYDDERNKENAGAGASRKGAFFSQKEIQQAFLKVGVDPSRLRQPLPRFYDPLGTATPYKVAAEDMEML